MTLYKIKPAFQNLLRPLVRLLARWGVTPNQVTIAAILLSAAGGAAITAGHEQPLVFLIIPMVLLVRMAMNAVDGMLAQEHHMQSRLGAVLNEMGDMVSDAFLYLPFALVISPTLVIAFVLLAILSETAGILGLTIGGDRRYDGPLGKSDRALVLGVMALAIGLGAEITTEPVAVFGIYREVGIAMFKAIWPAATFALMNILLIVTIFNRIRRALAQVPVGEVNHDTVH